MFPELKIAEEDAGINKFFIRTKETLK